MQYFTMEYDWEKQQPHTHPFLLDSISRFFYLGSVFSKRKSIGEFSETISSSLCLQTNKFQLYPVYRWYNWSLMNLNVLSQAIVVSYIELRVSFTSAFPKKKGNSIFYSPPPTTHTMSQTQTHMKDIPALYPLHRDSPRTEPASLAPDYSVYLRNTY